MNRILFLLPLFFALLISNTVDAKKKKYSNGDYYEGEWKKGNPNGMGKMTYADGSVYKGQWVNGQRCGEGSMFYADGSEYEGNWKEGKYDDEGKMFYTNGNIYEGFWKNGEFHGYGIMKYSNGDIHNGIFEKGKFVKGTMTQSNGYIYDGIFEKEKLVKGTMTQSDGGWFEGEWENQKFYNGKCNGYIGGGHYQGEWINGRFTGEYKSEHPKQDILSFDGVVSDDSIVEGKVEYRNNYIYEGQLQKSSNYTSGTITDYIPSGEGYLLISIRKKEYSFDCVIDGVWSNGKIVQITDGELKYNNTTYNVNLSNSYISIPYNSKICETITASNYYSEIGLELQQKIEQMLNTKMVKLEQPGTILTHLPLHQLNTIQSLTITGFIDETDLAIINKCTNLKFLDLSQANMKLSPKKIKEQQGETLAIGFVMNVVGLGFVADQLNEDENKKKYCVIPAYSFSKLSHLREIKFPNNVTEIDGYVCSNCEKLYKVELPAHIEYIGSNAFLGCTSLTDIQFPKSLKYLGSDGNNGSKCAFYDCIYNHRTTKTNQKYPSVNL